MTGLMWSRQISIAACNGGHDPEMVVTPKNTRSNASGLGIKAPCTQSQSNRRSHSN